MKFQSYVFTSSPNNVFAGRLSSASRKLMPLMFKNGRMSRVIRENPYATKNGVYNIKKLPLNR